MMYFFVLLLSMNISFWWWVWISVELLNWLLMLMIYQASLIMSFMIWQSLASIGLILNFLLYKNCWIIFVMLFFKMGLPPFHFWFWSFLMYWTWKSFNLFLFCHKYSPILILISYLLQPNLMFILIFSLLMFFMMIMILTLKILIFVLVLSDSSWMVISGLFSLKVIFLYYLINFMSMVILMNMFWLKLIKLNMYNLTLAVFILFLFGLPPFVTFMLKFYIVNNTKSYTMMMLLAFTIMNIFLFWMWTNSFLTKTLNLKLFNNIYLLLSMNLLWMFML